MRRIALAVTLAVVASACGGADGVSVEDAWSRPVPPVAPSSAIYMEISNGLDDAVTVVGASSNACSTVDIHETSMGSDDVMSMTPLTAGLVISAGDAASLEPGGLHLMCMDPSGVDRFDLTLDLDGTESITVSVVIEER